MNNDDEIGCGLTFAMSVILFVSIVWLYSKTQNNIINDAPPPVAIKYVEYSVSGFDVFIDERAGVACWYHDYPGSYAISCLPLGDTKLGGDQ